MPTTDPSTEPKTLVLFGPEQGITAIPAGTPLKRLNYFDGKFLRAPDLTLEQDYLRALVEQSNQAGGHGVAHGFDVVQSAADSLRIGPGLAVDARGRVLLLTAPVETTVKDLLARSRAAATPSDSTPRGTAGFGDCETVGRDTAAPVAGEDLYLVTIAHVEALCGQEDVYGKLCEEACITATQRPFRLEGVVIRATPLDLPPYRFHADRGDCRWRSEVASRYFEAERRRIPDQISKAGLDTDVWCLGAVPDPDVAVPLAVIGVAGDAIRFLDQWTARRERIDTVARAYWQ
jgi:hypothetical protein